ncbi:hypothetical protein [Noviherbaspirillum aridicola]|uniref:Uncharacterized protein n=1 Tax=Noviherbaspirillum aridicola TaxID=2849687 RepID=A0ABQ4Q1V9_9BURK|nr:hypothetical protein [Noviherbaspirillum aridicola]GIZ50785.1 hypothetical protein NCCP691_07990 [Noviherbaspirillum aridicola]
MANKALAKRQKMTIRVEPSQKAGKARKPAVPAAGQKPAGGGAARGPAPARLHERLLKRFS